ncbi:carboxymuconolactone decarboxylase family protein [soil metagenome]
MSDSPSSPQPTEQFTKGLAVRREVLGNAYVDKSLKDPDPFMAPMQKLVTEWCWGEIWTRPGLDRKTRSIVNLSMLTALNRPHEIKLHVLGALNNGLTKDEIMEVFLQAAIYCGVPASLDSFRVAKEVFKEQDALNAPPLAD